MISFNLKISKVLLLLALVIPFTAFVKSSSDVYQGYIEGD